MASDCTRQVLARLASGMSFGIRLGGCQSHPRLSQDLPALPPAKNALDAARNGYTFYKHLQADDGHWPGEYGGPLFLLPGLVIGSYVTGMPFKQEEKLEMIRYLFNRAHPEDGGWGMCVYFSTLWNCLSHGASQTC